MREAIRSVVETVWGSFLEPLRAQFGSRLHIIFRADFGAPFAEAGQWPRGPEAPCISMHVVILTLMLQQSQMQGVQRLHL